MPRVSSVKVFERTGEAGAIRSSFSNCCPQVSLLVQKPPWPCPTKKEEMEKMRVSSLAVSQLSVAESRLGQATSHGTVSAGVRGRAGLSRGGLPSWGL